MRKHEKQRIANRYKFAQESMLHPYVSVLNEATDHLSLKYIYNSISHHIFTQKIVDDDSTIPCMDFYSRRTSMNDAIRSMNICNGFAASN